MEVIRHGVWLLIFSFLLFNNLTFAEEVVEDSQSGFSNLGEDFASEQILDSILTESNELSASEDPHESISPFLPIVNLKYQEVHIPITENFSIDLYRTYTSQVYDQYPFKYGLKDTRNYHDQIWQLHPGYVVASMPSYYNPNKVGMNPILINGDGSRQSFIPMEGVVNGMSAKEFKSKEQWQGKFVGEHFEITDRKGTRYIYSNIVDINRRTIKNHEYRYRRYYLRDVYDLHGNNIHYDYIGNGIGVTRIRASNGVEVNIAYENIYIRKNMYGAMPKRVMINGQPVVTYNNGMMRSSNLPHTMYLIKQATYEDGRSYTYNYDYSYPYKHRRGQPTVVLKNIFHADGSKTEYSYEHEDLIQASQFDELLLRQKTVTLPCGKQLITKFHNKRISDNGLKLLERRVDYPTKTKTYIYRLPKNNQVWATGLPVNEITYGDSSKLESINYEWDNLRFSPQREERKDGWHKRHRGVDDATYLPVLTKRVITRYYVDGEDKFTTEYSNHDEVGHARIIKETGPNNSRVIIKNYELRQENNLIDLLSTVNLNDNLVLSREYDGYGEVSKEIKLGIANSFFYDELGNVIAKKDALGQKTRYLNYRYSKPTEIIYANGTKVQQTINPNGTVASTTDALGNTTNYSYDSLGQLTLESYPKGSARATTRNYSGQILSTIIRGNYQEQIYSNYLNLPLKEIDFDTSLNIKRQINYAYDSGMRPTFKSYPFDDLSQEQYGVYTYYDALDRVTSRCAPTPANCTYYQFLANNREMVTDPKGNATKFTYAGTNNPEGPIIKIEQPEDYITTIERTSLGSAKKINHNGIIRSYKYNENEQLIRETNPETGVTLYQYDANGNLTKTTLNDGTSIIRDFDSLNREISQKVIGSSAINKNYNSKGELIELSNANLTWRYQYDVNGNQIEESAIFPDSKTITRRFTYDYLDNLMTIVQPSGEEIALNPNAFGQASRLGDYISDISYTAGKQLQRLSRSTGLSSLLSYDEQRQLPKFHEESFANFSFVYDANNNLINYLDISDNSQSLKLEYDALDRLIIANGPWGEGKFSYDKQHNITQQKLGEKELNYIYTNNNQLTKVGSNSQDFYMGYDTRGNVTTYNNRNTKVNLIYDGRNQLISSNKQTYSYDGNGHRLITASGNGARITLYDSRGHLFYEEEPDGLITESIYLDDKRAVSKKYQKDEQEITYYHYDIFGNVIAASDNNKNIIWQKRYQPFGQEINNPETNETDSQGFAGKRLDKASGLIDFGARVYHPDLGRFLSIDPAAVQSDKPFTFNRYIYANNNPYKYIDPNGEMAEVIMPFVALGAVLTAPITLPAAGIIASSLVIAKGGYELGSFVYNKTHDNKDTSKTDYTKDSQPGSYRPERRLPRDKYGNPIPDSDLPHTQLGTKNGRNADYTQGREWGLNKDDKLKPIKDIDFTDHGRPKNHPNPHQHEYKPNATGGTLQRDPAAKPLRH